MVKSIEKQGNQGGVERFSFWKKAKSLINIKRGTKEYEGRNYKSGSGNK